MATDPFQGVTRDMQRLASREERCYRLYRKGLSWKEIGRLVGISPETARRDVERRSGAWT